MFKVNKELYLPEGVKYIIQKLMDNNYEGDVVIIWKSKNCMFLEMLYDMKI